MHNARYSFNTFAKMGQKKAGISDKVMSLTTTQDLKAHERDYNRYAMPGTLRIENTIKAAARNRFSSTTAIDLYIAAVELQLFCSGKLKVLP